MLIIQTDWFAMSFRITFSHIRLTTIISNSSLKNLTEASHKSQLCKDSRGMTQEQLLKLLQPADLKRVKKEKQINRVFYKHSNPTKFPHMHSRREEDITCPRHIGNENLWFSTWEVTVHTFREDKEKGSRAAFRAIFGFFCKTLPSFHFSYLLHPEGCHRGKLCPAALQEDSDGPQRKTLALLLNNPVSAPLSSVSGYRLLSPASNCNFFVVEKCDSLFSEPPKAISRQCRRCQFLKLLRILTF